MTESESSQYSLPPPSKYPNLDLFSIYDSRYKGVLYLNPHDSRYKGVLYLNLHDSRYKGVLYLNPHDSTLDLKNLICYGAGRRKKYRFQIPPSDVVYRYLVFKTTQIKKIRVTPPSSFTSCGYHYAYASLAREATISKYFLHATKPPLPLILSLYNQKGAKIRQNIPLLISNEELSEPQATTDDSDASSVKGSVNDGLQIAWNHLALPQYPSSNYYDPWLNHVYESMHCDALYHQDSTNAAPSSIASELVFDPQSFFTNIPSVPISLPPVNGEFDFEALTKNFKPYELWGNNQRYQIAYTVDGSSYQNESQGNNNQEDQTAYTIDGSFYKISRNPFDHIWRPCNPFGPIERPFPHLPSSYELADLGFV